MTKKLSICNAYLDFFISKVSNSRESAVKWGIRNSINTMNNNTTNKEIKSKFDIGYTKKMTPKFFIPLVVSHFQD